MVSETSPTICLKNDNNGVVVVHRLARQQYDQGDRGISAGWHRSGALGGAVSKT